MSGVSSHRAFYKIWEVIVEKIYEKRGSKWNNEYFDNGDDIIIKISKEESKEIYDILIDKEDFDKVKEGQ